MRKRLVASLLLLALAAAPSGAQPVNGTCTITSLAVIARSIGLTFPVDGANGFAFPVVVDPAAGTIALERSGWSTIEFTTLGITARLDMAPDTVTGTIDGGGNVILPDFTSTFTTFFCMPACELLVDATQSTGFGNAPFAGTIYPTRGAPLDFATGTLTLEGHVPLPEAPGGGSTSGLRLTCALSPVPDPATLPAAARAARVRGVVKTGPPLPATPPAAGDVPGDTLRLDAKLLAGARPLDPSRDLYLALDAPDGTPVAALLVPGGTLQGRKTLKAADEGGTTIVVLDGRKENDAVKATLRGTLSVRPTKKGLTLRLRHEGLALAALGSGARVTVQVGDEAGRADVTAKAGRKVTKLR